MPLKMAFLFSLFVIWTFFYVWRTGNDDNLSYPPKQRTYIIGVALLLLCGVYYFIGFKQYGSRLLNRFGEDRRIEHNGYYIHPSAPNGFLFTGQVDGGEGFEMENFFPEDSLYIKPLHDLKTANHENWTISHRLHRYPFRIDGVCKNIADDWWLKPDERLTVFRYGNPELNDTDTTFFTLRWTVAQPLDLRQRIQAWLGTFPVRNIFYFNQGSMSNGQRSFDHKQDTTFSKIALAEGLKLSSLAKNLDTRDRNWSDIFESITIVREIKNNLSSRVGVLIDKSLWAQKNIVFQKNARILIHQTGWSTRNDIIPASAKLFYGLGHQNSFGIVLSDSVIVDRLNDANVSKVSLNPPVVWPLPLPPAKADRVEFIITSASDYIPLDGYWFRSGRTSHPFYAKAIYRVISDSLSINDGKSIQSFRLDELACIGDLQQGVTVRLTQPKQAIAYAGPQAFFIIAILCTIFIIFNSRYPSTAQSKLQRTWTIIWATTLFLLLMRFLLGYRASLLPPGDASPLELENVFNKSLRSSLLALAVIPSTLIFTQMFIWIKKVGLQRCKLNVGLYFSYLLATMGWAYFMLDFGHNFGWVGAFFLIVLIALPIWWFGRLNYWHPDFFINFVTKPIAFLFFAVLTIFWLLAGSVVGRNESFLGIRISIGTHILVLLTVVVGMRSLLLSRKQWPIGNGLLAVLIIALLGVLVLFFTPGNSTSLKTFICLLIPIGILLCLIIIGRKKTLGSIQRLLQTPFYCLKWLLPIFMILCVALELFLIDDKGFFIYMISFSIAGLLAIFFQSHRAKWALAAAILVVIVFAVSLMLPEWVSLPLITKVVNPQNSVFYRFVSLKESEEDILLAGAGRHDLRKSSLLNNSHQNWQMLLYASHSEKNGVGYGRATLTDAGMTYPTTMADCVYAIYFLSEHGWLAGFLLISLFVMLGGFCFYLAGRIPDDFKNHHRIIPIALIGGFFIFNALYMASANIGQLIFTGQNIPFLSLVSSADLLQGAALLIMLTFLVFYNLDSESPDSLFPNQSAAKQVLLTISIAGWGWLVWLYIGLNGIAGAKSLQKDHDFDDSLFAQLQKNIPEEPVNPLKPPDPTTKKSMPWQIVGLAVKPTGVGGPSNVEAQYIKQLNDRKNKFDANGGLYYLSEEIDNGQRGIKLNLNRYYFKLRSPFRADTSWEGVMVATGDPKTPTVSALGHQFRVSLDQNIGAKSISLNDKRPGLSTVKAVVLRRSKMGDTFGELIREADTLYFEPGLPIIDDDWQIYLNGKRMLVSGHYPLNQRDLLVFTDEQDNYRRNLMYLGHQYPILSYVQWRNGRMRRMFPLGSELAMAYTLGVAADIAVRQGCKIPEILKTKLSMKMQGKLAEEIENVASSPRYQTRYLEKNIHRSNRIALTVMDAYSGQILAMPDFPTVNPGQPDFYEQVQKGTPSQQSDLLRNHNLKNHAIGSTIKPLVFSNLAAQYHGTIDLTKLEVYDYDKYLDAQYSHGSDEKHVQLANIRLDPAFDCQRMGDPEWISPLTFLIQSRDHYEAVIGLLGLLIDKDEWKNVFIPNKSPVDVRYNGTAYYLDLLAVKGEHSITTDTIPKLRVETTKRTLLFSGMEKMYQVYNDGELNNIYAESSNTFLPSFAATNKLIEQNPYLSYSLPEPVILKPNRMEYISSRLLMFLIGAAEAGRWNNVVMAESMARLVTGKKVYATLEPSLDTFLVGDDTTIATDSLATHVFEPLPTPLADLVWRNKNLFAPLQEVPRSGTLKELKALADDLEKQGLRLICKTGTINEREGIPMESEMLLFALGRWDNLREQFVEGKTLAGFLYLENVRSKNDSQAKGEFAKPIFNALARSDYFIRP